MSKASSRLVFLGVVFALLGILAVAFAGATTVSAILTLGIVLAIAGVAQIIYGIQGRKEGQLWPHLAFGCLALICGVLVLMNPITNIMGFTLVGAFLLVAGGLARIIGSAVERFAGWGWYCASGVVAILLGAMIFRSFPNSAIWAIGTFIGADLIVFGGGDDRLGHVDEESSPRIHQPPHNDGARISS